MSGVATALSNPATAVAVALSIGVLVGRLMGGSVTGLARLRVPKWIFVLVWLAIGLQLWPRFTGDDSSLARFAQPALLLSYGMIGLGCLGLAATTRGAVRAGAKLMAAGWLANLLVIGLNGGMPVSRGAMEAAGLDEHMFDVGILKHHAVSGETLLPILGDVIPLPRMFVVFSVGDVVLTGGLLVFISAAMRVRPFETVDTTTATADELAAN